MISSASSVISQANTLGKDSLFEGGKKTSSGDEILDFLSLLDHSQFLEGQNNILENLGQNNSTLDTSTINTEDNAKKNSADISKLMINKLQENEKVLNVKEQNLGDVELVSKNKLNDFLAIQSKNAKTVMKNQAPAHTTSSMGVVGISPSDIVSLRQIQQNKNGIKVYQKLQEPKIVKNELASDLDVTKFESKFFEPQSNITSINTESTKVSDKNSIESFAHQISEKIQQAQMHRPLVQGSSINLEIHHEELGHLSLNIKKGQKDLEIKIITGQMDAKHIIHENREALMSQLASRGITVNNFSIDSLTSSIATVIDDTKGSQSGKFENSSQQNYQQHHESSKHSNHNFTGREKREELWNILKDQREVMYA